MLINSTSQMEYFLASSPDFEWNFDPPPSVNSHDRKEEFNTIEVAAARRKARERPNEKQSSSSELRSASVGGFRHIPRETRSASSMSYLQLLSSATITYQEIYGGSRLYRARPVYYVSNNYRAAIKY